MEANIASIFFASHELTRTGDTYDSITNLISTMGYQDAFESPEAQDAWMNLHENTWSYSATTHDNLYEAAAALIAYINAICAQDRDNADQFIAELGAYETEFETIKTEYGIEITDVEIPDVNADDHKDGILDPPEYEEAKQPRGNDD